MMDVPLNLTFEESEPLQELKLEIIKEEPKDVVEANSEEEEDRLLSPFDHQSSKY
jgi:hypothetical protein